MRAQRTANARLGNAASDGGAIDCSLVNRSIVGLGRSSRCVGLQALGVARDCRHGLAELANVSLGDATADVREALGAARLAVAEDLLAEQILGCSDAPLSALVGLVLAVLQLDGETATLALLARRLLLDGGSVRQRPDL